MFWHLRMILTHQKSLVGKIPTKSRCFFGPLEPKKIGGKATTEVQNCKNIMTFYLPTYPIFSENMTFDCEDYSNDWTWLGKIGSAVSKQSANLMGSAFSKNSGV